MTPAKHNRVTEESEPLLNERETKQAGLKLKRLDFEATDYAQMSVTRVVEHCAAIYKATLTDNLALYDYDGARASEAAARVWMAILPELADRTAVQKFVACVSWGLRFGLIDAAKAKTLMYVAQQQLSIFRQEATATAATMVKKEPDAPLFAEGALGKKPTKDVG